MRIIEREEACNKEIFNVGTNENETSIREFAYRMRENYDQEFRLEGQELSPIIDVTGEEFYGEGYDDIDRRLLDNSKLIRLTDWQPEYNLDQMLRRIMTYYVEQYRKDQVAETAAAEPVVG